MEGVKTAPNAVVEIRDYEGRRWGHGDGPIHRWKWRDQFFRNLHHQQVVRTPLPAQEYAACQVYSWGSNEKCRTLSLAVTGFYSITGLIESGVKGHPIDVMATIAKKAVFMFMQKEGDSRLTAKVEEQIVLMQVWGSTTTVHSMPFVVGWILFDAARNPSLLTVSRLCLWGLLYVQTIEICFKQASITIWRLRTMFAGVMVMCFLRALLAASADVAHHSTSHQLDMLLALSCGVAQHDVKFAAPFLTLVFIADSWSQSVVYDTALPNAFFSNLIRYINSLALCAIVEQMARMIAESELDAKDALAGFRGMLRSSMDAEVVLDSHFMISERPTALELLLERQGLVGTSFLDVLPDEAIETFLTFTKRSSSEYAGKLANLAHLVPPAMRLGLRKANGSQVKGDAFLVYLPGRTRCSDRIGKEHRFILGIKEDPEASDEPHVQGAGPFVDQAAIAQAARQYRLASSAPLSSSQSRGHTQMPLVSWPEMVDVNLFLDGQTEWFDIKEVRVRFARLDDVHSMPCLKRAIPSQEWKANLPNLREAIWNAHDTSQEFVPRSLGPLHVHLPGIADSEGCLLADCSHLSLVRAPNINPDVSDLSAQPIYFKLQLYNFVQADRRGARLGSDPWAHF
ncbi:unnamed protein product [Symbiodinium natans]|uniref:Uncharacterized protein n=1 Tax=Symbiodinium natans TaxID=878477 RepID=A0A812LSP4_9DINO|nr:unnamed protein product [Symbiodinium natans]